MPCYCGFCCHDTIIAATPQNLWQQKSSTTSSELELAFIVELQYSVLCAVKQIGNISTSCSYYFCCKKVLGRSHFVLYPNVTKYSKWVSKLFTELYLTGEYFILGDIQTWWLCCFCSQTSVLKNIFIALVRF